MFYTVSLSDTDECVVGVIMFICYFYTVMFYTVSLSDTDECVVGVIMFILLCSIH